MATEVDIITKRTRTPNDQYSVLTEEQIRNIDQVIRGFWWLTEFSLHYLSV